MVLKSSRNTNRVFYNNEPVGDFAADLLIEDCVIVELKSARMLDDVHAAQCLNYLRQPALRSVYW